MSVQILCLFLLLVVRVTKLNVRSGLLSLPWDGDIGDNWKLSQCVDRLMMKILLMIYSII